METKQEQAMCAELARNCAKHGRVVSRLLASYDLTLLACDVWHARFDEIEDKVLSGGDYHVGRTFSRMPNAKIGDRITSHNDTWLLDVENFDRLQAELLPEYRKAGLTDEYGFYVENWDRKVIEARSALYDYIVLHLLPAAMADPFQRARGNITTQEKVIDILRSSYK